MCVCVCFTFSSINKLYERERVRTRNRCISIINFFMDDDDDIMIQDATKTVQKQQQHEYVILIFLCSIKNFWMIWNQREINTKFIWCCRKKFSLRFFLFLIFLQAISNHHWIKLFFVFDRAASTIISKWSWWWYGCEASHWFTFICDWYDFFFVTKC